MLAEKEVTVLASSVATDPIFVAIEMSRSKWVVGTHVPTSSKVGIHIVEWGDVDALLTLVDRLRLRAARMIGATDVPILCCYEAGYEGSGFTANSQPRDFTCSWSIPPACWSTVAPSGLRRIVLTPRRWFAR